MKIQKAVLDAITATKRVTDRGFRVNHRGSQLLYTVNGTRINIVEESGADNSNSWFADRTGQIVPPVLIAAVSVIEDAVLFHNGVRLKTCLGVIVES